MLFELNGSRKNFIENYNDFLDSWNYLVKNRASLYVELWDIPKKKYSRPSQSFFFRCNEENGLKDKLDLIVLDILSKKGTPKIKINLSVIFPL